MKNRTIIPCSLSVRFMIYGFFTILCQLAFLVLCINITIIERGPHIARYIYLPCIEYPIVSLALIIGGALLFDYINLR